MTGEQDLGKLLATLSPKLMPDEYVFCTFQHAVYGERTELAPVAVMREREGLTLVIPKAKADQYHVPYDAVFRGITLEVHSSLEAVGLTAAFATRLTEVGVSANVLAGFYHDHIFVLSGTENKALQALESLRPTSRLLSS